MLYDDVIERPEDFDFNITRLEGKYAPSPIDGRGFTNDDQRVLFNQDEKTIRSLIEQGKPLPSLAPRVPENQQSGDCCSGFTMLPAVA